MKNTKKNKSSLSGCIVVFVILFAFSSLMVELNIDTDVLRILFAVLVIGIIIYGFISDQKENMTLKKNIENLCWNDPESRSFQKIYESVCQNYVMNIKNVRKGLLYGTVFVILTTVALILFMLHIEKVEPIFYIIPVYVILQIVIIIINEKKERYYHEKILKEFIEISNKQDYSFKYIDKSDKQYFNKIKSLIKDEYRKIDKWQTEDKVDEYETMYHVSDCIEGEVAGGIHTKISKIRSSYRKKSTYLYFIYNWWHSYEGNFISIDKNLHENIEIILKTETKYDSKDNLFLVNNDRFNKYYEIYSDNK